MVEPPLIAETAGVILIGTEILSAKVREANLYGLATLLRKLGVELLRTSILRDDVDEIADTVRSFSKRHDVVFTSGGVGPTHDDVTVIAVARAFEREVVIVPELAEMIRAHYKERCTDAHLAMARGPAGTSLETGPDGVWPAMRCENVWMLPGVPEIFAAKLRVVEARVQGLRPIYSRALYTQLDEPSLKDRLDAVVAAFPTVEFGSYPKWRGEDYQTKITLDGKDNEAIELALSALLQSFGEVVRVE